MMAQGHGALAENANSSASGTSTPRTLHLQPLGVWSGRCEQGHLRSRCLAPLEPLGPPRKVCEAGQGACHTGPHPPPASGSARGRWPRDTESPSGKPGAVTPLTLLFGLQLSWRS